MDEAGFDDDEKYSEEINFTDKNFFKDENSNKSYIKSKDIKKISTNNIKKCLKIVYKMKTMKWRQNLEMNLIQEKV